MTPTDQVRFDGVDESNSRILIDRKISTYSTPKARHAAQRQSEALRQNGMTGRWEVPNQAEVKRAKRILSEENVLNIDVALVPER